MMLYLSLHSKMSAAVEAELYKERNGLQQQDGQKLMDELCIEAGQTVLDLGCGTGNLTAMLVDKVGPEGRVVGVDPDAERVSIARSDYGHLTNLTFAIENSEDFPNLGDPVYDVIFSNHVIYHISSKQIALENCFNSLKTGGKLGFSFLERLPDHYVELLSVVNPVNLEYLLHYFKFEPKDALIARLKDAGFVIESLNSQMRHVSFESIKQVCETISTAMHGALDMNEAASEKLKKFRTGVCADGKVLWKHFLFYLIATKKQSGSEKKVLNSFTHNSLKSTEN